MKRRPGNNCGAFFIYWEFYHLWNCRHWLTLMSDNTIPFELHITADSLSATALDVFIDCCRQQEAKPMIIELARGVYNQQPMLNKVVYRQTLDEARTAATQLSEVLLANNIKPKRLKIEIPANYAPCKTADDPAFTPYFEWHGKVVFDRPDALLALCHEHGVHLSRNALKKEADTRFVTLREFGSKTDFERRVNNLVHVLQSGGWHAGKQQAEYCVYDNNISLDNGWLSM